MRRAVQIIDPQAPTDEPDRIEGQPHPRETFELVGQNDSLAKAACAIRTGRPPQGWLICGEPGIGKATLAYRIARYLLRYGATADGPADLSVGPGDLVSRQVEGQAHPGLLVIRRPWDFEKKRLKTVITVDEVRRLGEFFGLKSASGGWRIVLIDAVDEMNEGSANALLKNLEEPPPLSLVMLICHAPGSLLPTIRSRVQRLELKPLEDATVESLLAERAGDLPADARRALARIAEGSVGLALQLASDDGAELAMQAEKLISTDPRPDWLAILKLAERVSRRSGDLAIFGEFVHRAATRVVRGWAAEGRANDRAIELPQELRALFVRATEVNLDPRQTIIAAANLIRSSNARQPA